MSHRLSCRLLAVAGLALVLGACSSGADEADGGKRDTTTQSTGSTTTSTSTTSTEALPRDAGVCDVIEPLSAAFETVPGDDVEKIRGRVLLALEAFRAAQPAFPEDMADDVATTIEAAERLEMDLADAETLIEAGIIQTAILEDSPAAPAVRNVVDYLFASCDIDGE